ncbi:MAG: NADP(H)-dependent aldo-keto reductase [Cyanobacteria bacterium P01_H01_bin.74]
MEKRPLGNTEIQVSKICLGTMTWGDQNTEAEAHEQMDFALENGINFFDAAELYPVPPKAETAFRTEAYIGNWFEHRKNRGKVILATKVCGRSARITWMRDGQHCLDRKNIEKALDDSLKRLKTDYIDLYQVHWPDRTTNFFGHRGFVHPAQEEHTVSIEETLTVLGDLVSAGKIRTVGISNETPWGMMQYLNLAEKKGLPRVVSIQNPYNLLNRQFEVGLAEMAVKEHCGLLAYSPLAFGILSGKYLENQWPKNARLTLFPDHFGRYNQENAKLATEAYVQLAKTHGLSPAKMALAFVTQQAFTTSNIIGATTVDQLKENIESAALHLSDEILQEINAIHARYPDPSP